MRILTLLGKEARIIARSRLLLTVLILYPLVIVAILGFAFSQPNQRVPIAIVNEDINPQTGQPSFAFVQNPIANGTGNYRVSSADVINRLALVADLHHVDVEEARRLLLTGQVQAIVRFPFNFARDIAALDSSGEINITIDRSDAVRANAMEVQIRGYVQQFQEGIVEEKVKLVVQAIQQSIPDITVTEDPLYPGFRGVRNRLVQIRDSNLTLSPQQRQMLTDSIRFIDNIIDTLDRSRNIVDSIAIPVEVSIQAEKSGTIYARDLIVPAALGLSIFWTGTVATSSLVVYDRESHAYTRLRITPATTGSIYGSKIVLALIIVIVQALLILLVSVLAWQIRVDNLGLTLSILLLASLAAIGLGLFIAGLSRDVNGVVLLSVLITFPMMLLGGLFFPLSFMPEAAQAVAQAFPLTHTVAGLRGSMLRGFSFADGGQVLLFLVAFGVVLSVLGIVMGKRLERRR